MKKLYVNIDQQDENNELSSINTNANIDSENETDTNTDYATVSDIDIKDGDIMKMFSLQSPSRCRERIREELDRDRDNIIKVTKDELYLLMSNRSHSYVLTTEDNSYCSTSSSPIGTIDTTESFDSLPLSQSILPVTDNDNKTNQSILPLNNDNKTNQTLYLETNNDNPLSQSLLPVTNIDSNKLANRETVPEDGDWDIGHLSIYVSIYLPISL
jgi:hypothetical protein